MKRLFLVLMLMSTAAQAETYTWTDKEGTVHFSDSLSSVPAHYRKSAALSGTDGNVTMTDTGGVSSSTAGKGAVGKGAVATQVEGLKERMMNDEGIMRLISALQGDPEMQAILNDPAILNAVQSGDVNTLTHNPTFLKLLNNPRVKEIQKMMQPGESR